MGDDRPESMNGFVVSQSPVCLSAARRALYRSLVILLAVVGVLAWESPSPALAAFQHPYLSRIAGTPGGSFSESLCGVTVDPASQDVYVADPGNDAIDVFNSSGAYQSQINGLDVPSRSFSNYACSVAVSDVTGEVYVADSGPDVVYVFSALGSYLSTIEGTSQESLGGGYVHVAVDQSSGDVYVANSSGGVVDRFNSANEYQSQLTGLSEPWGLTTNSSGDVYVADSGAHGVYELSPSGSQIGHISGTPAGLFTNLTGVAVDSAGDVYVTDQGPTNVLDEFDSAGAFIGQATGTPLGPFSEPEGIAVNSGGEIFLADRGSPAAVDRFGPFTPEAPSIAGESVLNVTSTSATLTAGIDPNGAETTYHFEYDTSAYDDSAEHGTNVPLSETAIGSGVTGVAVSLNLQDLAASSTYYYRVVATNRFGTVDGPDQSFTTAGGAGEFALPDNRAYELVSPPDKNGALILPIEEQGGIIEAAEDGSAITYLSSAPLDKDPPSNTNETQTLSRRAGGGWSSQDISTFHNAPTKRSVGPGQEYRFFSPDLSQGLIEPLGDTPLSPEAPPNATEALYLSEDHEGGPYEPLLTARNLAPTALGNAAFVGATPDLDHVVLSAGEALMSMPAAEGLYEWSGGALELISVLPEEEGGTPAADPVLGYESGDIRHAISNDGSRVIWSEGLGEHNLYMRDMRKGETVELNVAESGVEGGEGRPLFQAASEDGSRVFFTDSRKLTRDSTASGAEGGASDLYEFEVTSAAGEPLAGRLTDLTADVENSGESADVQGDLLGASEDGSYVYFVANGMLASNAKPGDCQGEASVAGATCNLYVMHYGGAEWKTAFIGTLSSEDSPDWEAGSEHYKLQNLTSRPSPDGRYLAFMSDRSLTGYNNGDAKSGAADEEVFLYRASENLEKESGSLVCASCDPTGARPVGLLDTGRDLFDYPRAWAGHWLAASVPGWTPMSKSVAQYQSRYLSDSGRLFFDSADALVSQDTNGKEDVYEYEPEGEGSCMRANGCIALISRGTSGGESVFLDASADGTDVFFLTAQSLVPEDTDTAFDVYDAHVCTPAAPCPSASAAPPPCATADACRAAPSPQPSIFGPQPSATFSPAPLLTPTKTVKAGMLTRTQKLAKALKACKKRPKRRRSACERQARRSYGPARKAKKSHGRGR